MKTFRAPSVSDRLALVALSISVLLMTIFMAIDGQPLVMPLIIVFVVTLAVIAALAWVALRTRSGIRAEESKTRLLERRPTA